MSPSLTLDSPGLYFHAGKTEPGPVLDRIGPFHAGGSGLLYSRARRGPVTILFHGILLDRDTGSGDDAALALEAYSTGGLGALHDLDGYFNILLIDKTQERAWLVSDAASSQPWYAYKANSMFVAAPTPVFFADLGLTMTLDRQALYETIRLMHPGGKRTMVSEVERVYPGVSYAVEPSGDYTQHRFFEWDYHPDGSRDLDSMAAQIKDLVAGAVRGVIDHPRLRDRPIELSLTGGMDSRHILGELLEQGRPPSRIRHVHWRDAEMEPVKRLCDGLELDLLVRPVRELDFERLTKRWMQRSGGLVCFHQSYLMHMLEDVPEGGVVGFDGYLMDWFLGIYPKDDPSTFERPEDPIWNRRRPSMLALHALFHDASNLSRRGRDEARIEAASYEGPHWFKFMMLDFHRRGLHYTGPPHTMMAKEAFYFTPGACRRALEFYLHSDYRTGGEKRARLRSMQRYFPQLARYPGPSGVPYTQYTTLRKQAQPRTSYLEPWPRALVTGFRHDPAPGTVHEWLRKIETLRNMHRRAVRDSALSEDGHLRRTSTRFVWRAHRLGAYEGWTLLNLLSAEVAYRVLVRREKTSTVMDWLIGS